MKLYYTIWVDAIQKANSSKNQNRDMWKFYTMIGISMAMAINFITFMAILQRNILQKSFYNLELNIFPGTKLNALISFIILFLLPPMIMNYLLIFRKKRYELLVKKYKYYNGKVFMGYFLGSIALPFVLLLIGYMFENYL